MELIDIGVNLTHRSFDRDRDEVIERLVSILARRCQPDFVQLGLRAALHLLGHFVQHIGGFVNPATLFARRRIHLWQRRPEAQRPVRRRQLRIDRQAALLAVEQE